MRQQEVAQIGSITRNQIPDGYILTVESKLLLRIGRIFEPHADKTLVVLRSHDGLATEVSNVRSSPRSDHSSRDDSALNGCARFRSAYRFQVLSYYFVSRNFIARQ